MQELKQFLLLFIYSASFRPGKTENFATRLKMAGNGRAGHGESKNKWMNYAGMCVSV